MSEPEGGEEEDRDESASERPESERGSPPLQPPPSPSWRRESRGEREKDDSQTKWRERTKTRREREGGCSAVHYGRSWGQLKPPPLLGLAVLLSSLSASTIYFLRFISAVFDAKGADAILSFEKFCCNIPRPLLQVPVSIWITFLNSILIHLLINWVD
ncbi:hypothetical protein S245_067009 [Arachis hypogaea]